MDPREKRSKKAIRALLVTLDEVAGGEPLAIALANALRAEDKLGPAERRAVARGARGVVRELRRIDQALGLAAESAGVKLKGVIRQDRSLLRYLALRVSVEWEPPARSLEELRLPGPRRPRAISDRELTAVAERLLPADKLPLPEDPLRAIALRRSVPDFLVTRLAFDFGAARADAILGGLNEEARYDLRANRLLITREALQERLREEGVATTPCTLAPHGLVAEDRTGLFGKAHAGGLFELQDEGSQLLAALCGVEEGMLVIDWCAGSGGKTLALAAEVGATGKVIACDAVARRLSELPQRARRAKAQRTIEVSGARPDASLEEKADVVLVDAPCSGIGSLRREVDLRWRMKDAELDALPALQLQILTEASRFVRRGGRLVYGTCSPLQSEDEAVVAAFLTGVKGFKRQSAKRTLPPSAHGAVSEAGDLRTFPDQHGTGAFFGAVLVRR